MVKRNVKTILALFMVFILAAAMVGCTGSNSGTESNTDNQISEQPEENSEDENVSEDTSGSQEEPNTEDSAENGKILVAYFSHSGNTKKIAEEIQSKTGADIFEIKTVNVYSDDYNTVLDEAKAEQNDKARPELSEKVTDMSQYQTVILGFPIWWGDMPMAVYSFLDEYDLSGKMVLPFCTHGGSGLSGTDKKIGNEEKDAKVADGLAIRDSSLDDADGDIDQWLRSNGVMQ
ncbi:MAG: NAD(P)H-dependent oxidoreductase [Clostridium sp.]|nr:NAD(P)H-dependent oxidoreductase [Clostridium sp.]